MFIPHWDKARLNILSVWAKRVRIQFRLRLKPKNRILNLKYHWKENGETAPWLKQREEIRKTFLTSYRTWAEGRAECKQGWRMDKGREGWDKGNGGEKHDNSWYFMSLVPEFQCWKYQRSSFQIISALKHWCISQSLFMYFWETEWFMPYSLHSAVFDDWAAITKRNYQSSWQENTGHCKCQITFLELVERS